jgi:hypothetical protein
MNKKILCAFVVMLIGGTCHAALFSGPSAFTTGPTTQLGALFNFLTLTDNGSGFVVSGQVIIAVPPGPIAGTLVSWTVDRPLDPTFGTGSLITTTALSGFSQPPVGSIGSTNGFAESLFTNPGLSIVSLSQIPISLVAGLDVPPWNNLVVNSTLFSYTSGGVNFLRQQFDLDGIQLSGPGGNWIVDVPLVTHVTVVPEPSTFALLGLALVSLAGYRFGKRLA